MIQENPKKHRTLEGVVLSTAMQKTAVVRVDRLRKHPKYERRYRVSKKYKAHNEDTTLMVGDAVAIEECRPLSRDKRWRVVRKLAMAPAGAGKTANPETSETEPV